VLSLSYLLKNIKTECSTAVSFILRLLQISALLPYGIADKSTVVYLVHIDLSEKVLHVQQILGYYKGSLRRFSGLKN
jgi:hypothetical protein